MRSFGLLGLVVSVALTGAAFAAGSASAVTLCKSNTSPCPEGERHAGGTVLEGAAGTAANSALVSAAMEVKCDEATVEAETLAESEVSLSAKIAFPSFTTCVRAGVGECTTVEALNDPYSAQITEPDGSGNGTLATGSSVTLKYQCGAIACTYAAAVKFSITGGSPATIATTNWEMAKQAGSSGECSQTAKWTVQYTLSSPSPLFVEGEP